MFKNIKRSIKQDIDKLGIFIMIFILGLILSSYLYLLLGQGLVVKIDYYAFANIGLFNIILKNFIKKELLVFLLLWIPAIIGSTRTGVYSNLDSTLPKDLSSIQANDKLDKTFNMNTTHIVLVDSSMSAKETRDMIKEMKEVSGVKSVIGTNSFIGPMIPEDLLPEDLLIDIENENWQLIMITSEYKVASEEVHDKIGRASCRERVEAIV